MIEIRIEINKLTEAQLTELWYMLDSIKDTKQAQIVYNYINNID